jgi:molybdopterin-guanine dinucleotide biosynthesis protein A
MKADTGRAGIVLAGGRSTRFGDGDKALATLAGRPLLCHAVEAVSPVVDDVLVSCRDDQREAFESAVATDVTLVTDPIDDLGPVAGLRTALCETDRHTAVVTPCDTPLIPSAFLGHLLDRVEQSTTAGVVIHADGYRQPLPTAVNARAAAAAATEALDTSGTLCDVVDALAPVAIPEHHVRATVGLERLLNVNTRDDLARAELVLARRSTGPVDRELTTDDGTVRPNNR